MGIKAGDRIVFLKDASGRIIVEPARVAIHAYARGRGDFADYLIREAVRRAGRSRVATFDSALLRQGEGFVRPQDA